MGFIISLWRVEGELKCYVIERSEQKTGIVNRSGSIVVALLNQV